MPANRWTRHKASQFLGCLMFFYVSKIGRRIQSHMFSVYGTWHMVYIRNAYCIHTQKHPCLTQASFFFWPIFSGAPIRVPVGWVLAGPPRFFKWRLVWPPMHVSQQIPRRRPLHPERGPSALSSPSSLLPRPPIAFESTTPTRSLFWFCPHFLLLFLVVHVPI